MFTILLLAALIVLAIATVSTVGAAASFVMIVLFGDVIVATLIILGIMKIHKHFKNKKNIKTK